MELVGFNLPAERKMKIKADKPGEMDLPIDLEKFRARRTFKIIVGEGAELVEAEPNDQPGQATAIAAPCAVAGRIWSTHQAGNVDLFVTAVGADLSLTTPTVSNVAYQGSTYLPSVAAGTYQVRAVPAGTAPAARSAAVSINLASVALAANSARTIIAADNNIGGAPLRFIALTDR